MCWGLSVLSLVSSNVSSVLWRLLHWGWKLRNHESVHLASFPVLLLWTARGGLHMVHQTPTLLWGWLQMLHERLRLASVLIITGFHYFFFMYTSIWALLFSHVFILLLQTVLTTFIFLGSINYCDNYETTAPLNSASGKKTLYLTQEQQVSHSLPHSWLQSGGLLGFQASRSIGSSFQKREDYNANLQIRDLKIQT